MNSGAYISATPSKAEAALGAALRVMSPLLKFLLRSGVTHQMLCNALKKEMLDGADEVLAESGVKRNDSSLSALTGINRKDVREWRAVGQTLPAPKTLGPAMEVFTHWKNEPKYRSPDGRHLILARLGDSVSFESLAKSVSNDVHPLTILREMERLGVVKRHSDGDFERVELLANAFVPSPGTAEMLDLMVANVGDHIATSLHNVVGQVPPMLEQSIYADKISAETANKLAAIARAVWARAHQEIFDTAKPLCDADQATPHAVHRFRIGMYFYQTPSPTERDS